ncbi:helix-turn-helix domain-containing protein [Gammaproteobacteria bacterium]|nr:helix-turn-helix domain-containing protein [Gammaproteobacteria bacterium]
MPDKTSLSSRLISAMESKKINQSQLARILNVKPQTIQSICSGKTRHPRNLDKIAMALDVQHSWLLTGNSEDSFDNRHSNLFDTKHSGIDDNSHSNQAHMAGHTGMAKQPSIKAVSPYFAKDRLHNLYFDAAWLDKMKLDVKQLVFAINADIAMSPIIAHNSEVLINTADTKIENGKIYAFLINNKLFIRRLTCDVNYNLVLSAENPAYLTEKISPAMINMIGKVISTHSIIS